MWIGTQSALILLYVFFAGPTHERSLKNLALGLPVVSPLILTVFWLRFRPGRVSLTFTYMLAAAGCILSGLGFLGSLMFGPGDLLFYVFLIPLAIIQLLTFSRAHDASKSFEDDPLEKLIAAVAAAATMLFLLIYVDKMR